MAMSQGTSTFLACFGGFWLVWALVVLLCCLCSFLQRRLKQMKEERHREQCLRTVEAESLTCPGQCHAPSHINPALAPSRETPHICTTQLCALQASSSALTQTDLLFFSETDVFGKPPCYEEAVLMEDPPPPYSEVLADPRGGTYFKPSVLQSKPPPVIADRGYSSLIRLPSSQRWDSLGHLLSNMDLNHNHLTPPQDARTPRELVLYRARGLEPSCGMPTAFPLLGRSTAV
uniref:Uncharacterized protein n=1 Tax=Neogobius melanostomus TaxID=47308 RepID=A0A8C6WME2_9GOBI